MPENRKKKGVAASTPAKNVRGEETYSVRSQKTAKLDKRTQYICQKWLKPTNVLSTFCENAQSERTYSVRFMSFTKLESHSLAFSLSGG